MILFTIMIFIYKDVMGMGEKTPKENGKQKKKSPLVALPSPLLRYGGRLFFGARKTPKTSQTYPKWERVPNLMGQKKKEGLGTVRIASMNLFR